MNPNFQREIKVLQFILSAHDDDVIQNYFGQKKHSKSLLDQTPTLNSSNISFFRNVTLVTINKTACHTLIAHQQLIARQRCGTLYFQMRIFDLS